MLLAVATGLVAIEVTGADRVSHLDAVTTQRFLGAVRGTVLGWLVLDGKGAPRAMGWALVDDERILLLAPPPSADHVLDVLATRTFLADVSFTRQDAPVTSLAGDVDIALVDAGLDLPPDTWVHDDEQLVARHAFGVEVVGTAGGDAFAAGAEVVDADTLWLSRGEPRWGHEVVAGRLPEEYGLLATHVHLGKGCYPGQEPIAHMWMLGRPRRQLVRLGPADDADEAAEVPDSASEPVEVDVTGRRGDTALGFARPDVVVGSKVDDELVVVGAVGGDREVVGWTPAQTRRRDRAVGDVLPSRRP